MSVDLRFHIQRLGSRVRLFGALSGAANVALLDEMKRDDANVFDLSGLASASWAGLQRLHAYLAAYDRPLELVGIPSAVYRFFRLLPIVNGNVVILEIEVETFDPSDPQGTVKRTMVRMEELQRLAVEQGPILSIDGGRQILGIVEHIVPLYFHPEGMIPPLFRNPWCLANNVEATFWLSICQYFECTLGLAVDLVETSRQALRFSERTLYTYARSIEACADLIGATPRASIADALQSVFARFDAELVGFRADVDATTQTAGTALRTVQIACWEIEALNPGALLDAAALIANAAAMIRLPTTDVPGVARVVEQARRAATRTDELVGALQAVALDARVPELLVKIRAAFFIMDPMSEGDWGRSVAAIAAELQSMDESASTALSHLETVMRGQALLAGWREDLGLVQAALPEIRAGRSNWRELWSGIIHQWAHREVCDEECHLRGFHFPELFAVPEAKQDTDDESSAA